MPHELIGQGNNHHVWRSKHHPQLVLKTPKPHIARFNAVFRPPLELQRDVLNLDPDLPSDTNLTVPKSRLISLYPQYIIAQEYISEDNSVPDILASFEAQNLHYFANKYRSNATNFISKEGQIYWIDTNYGPINYLLLRSGLLTPEQYQSLKIRLKRTLRK